MAELKTRLIIYAFKAHLGGAEPVAATLYLRGKRWSVGWNGDFIEVLLGREDGVMGSLEAWGVAEGDWTSFW